MKILKKLASITAAAAAIWIMSANVFAEESMSEFVYREIIADDGAKIELCLQEDENGALWCASSIVEAPQPKNPWDFPEGDYEIFLSSQDFYDYMYKFETEHIGRHYTSAIAEFYVSFDPPLDFNGIITQMDGGKCYIIDLDEMSAWLAGYYCAWEEMKEDAEYPESEMRYCEYVAEDGTKLALLFILTENGGLEYVGCEPEENVSNVDYAYSVDENSRVIISSIVVGEVDTGYTLYSDPDMIPIADNEVLASIDVEQYVEDESGRLAAVLNIKKYYVITIDGMDSTVRYAGCSYSAVDMYSDFEPSPDSDWSDGATVSPKTGSGGNFFAVMLAAAGVAVLAKCAKK